jgi:hypothetical protein
VIAQDSAEGRSQRPGDHAHARISCQDHGRSLNATVPACVPAALLRRQTQAQRQAPSPSGSMKKVMPS